MNAVRCFALLLTSVASLSLMTAPAADGLRIRPVSSVYVDGKGGGLSRPEGVACGNGELWVADTGNARILRYTIVDRTVAPLGEFTPDQVGYPTRIARTSDGGVLVVDGRILRVGRLSPDGGFAGWLGLPAGRTDPIPRSVHVGADGREYVLDVANGRVVVFDRDARLVRTIDLGDDYGFVSDLATDRSGRVYLVDGVGSRVWFVGTDEGSAAEPLQDSLEGHDVKFPVAVVVRDEGELILADQNAGDLVSIDASGKFLGRSAGFGWTEGYLRYPSALCLDGDLLFVADRENDRVQIFSVSSD